MRKMILIPFMVVCLWGAPEVEPVIEITSGATHSLSPDISMGNPDAVVMQAPDNSVLGESKLEIILSAIIAILGILSKVKWDQASRNDVANEILIRAIEMAGDRDVKRAVAAVAESEGQTEFITKKVKEVTNEPPSPQTPPAPLPPK